MDEPQSTPEPEELQRLQHEAAEACARADFATAEAAELRASLRTLEDEAAAAAMETEALRRRGDTALARYRETLLRDNPALHPDIIVGDSIDDLDAAAESARAMADRVREQIEARSREAHAPAGAPARSVPDLTALSPAEKIRYGLSQRAVND
jgi:hypothetical protein